jgi:hypothetical protein
VSQIKEQLEAIGDTVEEAELVMTTLNGLGKRITPPRSFKGHESLKRITLATNAIAARRWDTL